MLERKLIFGDCGLMGSDAEVEKELSDYEKEFKAAIAEEKRELEEEAFRKKMALRSNKRIMKFS
jgi:hypothetical protein